MEKSQTLSQKPYILSGFILKLIAIFTMTCDHLGLFLNYYFLPSDDPLVLVLRTLGRIALPLFCFLIVEGVIHTKSFKKYILRLSISLLLISTALIFIKNVPAFNFPGAEDFGNIFIDLTLGAIGVYCLKHKNNLIKLLAVLPLTYAIVSYFITITCEAQSITIHWFPYFLRTQYGWYGVTLIFGFYIAQLIAKQYCIWYAEKTGVDGNLFLNTKMERAAINVTSCVVNLAITALFVIIINSAKTPYIDLQIFAIFGGAFILLYNGNRGYNSKWYEYTCYAYYPAHILLLAFIFYIITL